MTLVALDGAGFWMPTIPGYMAGSTLTLAAETLILDADEEEAQLLGKITIDGGGSKTFGTSSKIGWYVGANPVFATGSTLRVGVKSAARIETTAGPAARATIGAAAFDVWDNLVGGTDTLTQLTWREETMTAGTPFTVTHGDWVAVCLHLDVTSGTPLIRIRGTGGAVSNSTLSTLVTAGPTYTAQIMQPNIVLGFDDGTLGWFDPCKIHSLLDTVTASIGNGNSIANIVEVPFPCQIDALAVTFASGTNTGDAALELLATPFATPSVLATIPIDANVMNVSTTRLVVKQLLSPQTLAANTPYALSLKQTTATAITGHYWEVANAAYFKPMGMGANCYAADSTGGATFVVQNSGLRRYHLWMRVSAVDDGTGGAASGGGGSVFGAAGGVIS